MLWHAIRDRPGFATFVQRAAPQLQRWVTGHGWTRYGWGSVAEKEVSLASVLEGMLQAPDHWTAFAAGHDRAARARALADWHTLMVDRLVGSEDEDLLDRLVHHPLWPGPSGPPSRPSWHSDAGPGLDG